TRDRAPDHPDIINNKPLIGRNRWPPDMPEFRAATIAYYAAMEAMTTRLVPVVAMALGLPPDYFAEAFAESNCTIRLIHYSPQPNPEDNELGFAPYTDNNSITFLAQSALPGLQVRTAAAELNQQASVTENTREQSPLGWRCRMNEAHIGRSLRRLEDSRFLTGQGRYVDDIDMPGQLHGIVLRSPHGHAAIDGIDTAAARAMSGVRGVF